jgi:hypothetical protein
MMRGAKSTSRAVIGAMAGLMTVAGSLVGSLFAAALAQTPSTGSTQAYPIKSLRYFIPFVQERRLRALGEGGEGREHSQDVISSSRNTAGSLS